MRTYLKILLVVLGILCIPFIAMQFTTEVQWQLNDFLVAGVLLFVGISLSVFIFRRHQKNKYRFLYLGICIALFALLWMEMAVGIFGSPLAGS